MLKRHRLIAAAAVAGAVAVAGPVAGAAAAQPAAVVSPGSNIPCYPFPAFCGPDGQPAAWAPTWVWPALGLTPPTPVGLTPPTPVLIPPIIVRPPGTVVPLG